MRLQEYQDVTPDKIRCNQMHPLLGALPVSYVPPRSRTSQYRRTFIPHSVSLWNDISDQVFDGVGLEGFKSGANAYFLAQVALSPFVCYYFFLFLLSVYMLVLWGWGLWTDRV